MVWPKDSAVLGNFPPRGDTTCWTISSDTSWRSIYDKTYLTASREWSTVTNMRAFAILFDTRSDMPAAPKTQDSGATYILEVSWYPRATIGNAFCKWSKETASFKVKSIWITPEADAKDKEQESGTAFRSIPARLPASQVDGGLGSADVNRARRRMYWVVPTRYLIPEVPIRVSKLYQKSHPGTHQVLILFFSGFQGSSSHITCVSNPGQC